MGETIISNVETLHVHVPVTAVCFVDDASEGKQFLLSGRGGFLSIFDLTTFCSYNLLSVVNVLGSRNIHGFCVTDDLQVCAFGERFVAIIGKLKDEILKQKRFPKAPCYFVDRVLDVRWLAGCQNHLGILLAHNEFQLLDPISNEIVKTVRCELDSILFSGLIVERPQMPPFVIAGACLGYLYLWQPFETAKVQIQLNLSNAGGMFCAAVKPDDCRSLAIACEDRGIYVFKVDIVSKRIDTLQTLFGHGARIWKVCWAEKHLVSAGEDSQVLLWNLADGSVLHRFQSSSNTNIFALNVDPLNPSRIAAGLSDGSVRLYQTPAKLEVEANTEVPGDDPAVRIIDPLEHVVCLCFVDADTLFYVSSSGKLAVTHILSNCSQVLDTNPHYSMAVVLAAMPLGTNRALIGLAHGVPSEISVFELSFQTTSNCLTKAAEFPCHHMPRVYLLGFLASSSSTLMFASNFDVAANCVFDVNGTGVMEFNLSKAAMPTSSIHVWALKHFDKIAITCGLRLDSANNGDELFAFGDNCGSVFAAKRVANGAVILQVFPHIHGRDGCSSLSYSANQSAMISCGGSSSVSFFRVEHENSENPLSLLNTIKPCSSLDYTVLHFTNNSREFVCGFAQKSFMVSAIHPSQLTLTRHYCSGRKREWDLFVDSFSVKFAYIRAGQAYLVSTTIPMANESSREAELQLPLHGLRIHDCKFICHLPVSDSFVFVLVSEDDTGSIVAIKDQSTSFHILHRLAGHVSGVRCVQAVRQVANGELKFLLLTGGSRGIAIAWSLTLADVDIADLKKATFCRKIAQVSLTNQPISSLFELPRSSQTQLDNVPKGSWRQSKVFGPPLAPDMRFMDIATAPDTSCQAVVYIATACSDATVRIFELDSSSTPTFQPILCFSEGLSFCQLRIVFAIGVLASGDTGGRLNFWPWPSLLQNQDATKKPISVRIHQSGINALLITRLSEVFSGDEESSSLIAFTGGDDTAIVVSKLDFASPTGLQCTTLLRIDSAHSSQISGLSFIKPLSLICTVSIDQRVRLWKFPVSDHSNQQNFLGGFVTCVADCSSLAVATKSSSSDCATLTSSSLNNNNNNLFVLVVGEGCQFIKMSFK